MKHISITAFVLFFCVVAANAQSKVDNTIIKANNALNQVDNAGNTIDRAGNAIGKAGKTFKSLFGDKKNKSKDKEATEVKDAKEVKKSADTASSAFNTTIRISGITFMKLKALQKNALDCECVTSSDMAFNAEASSLKIAHSGKTEDLLKLLLDKSKDIFTENQIQSFEEGKIEIKLN
jgi:hypothetical protein